jgi:transglutaminase-like putative cysteine protease
MIEFIPMPNGMSQTLGDMTQTQGAGGQTQTMGSEPALALTITHETVYRYPLRVEQAHHLGYLRPLALPNQILENFSLVIEPEPSHCITEKDIYGNSRSIFELYAPHESLRVCAISRVLVWERFGGLDLSRGGAWEQVAHELRYVSGGAFRGEVEFVFASPYVPIHAELRDYALQSFTPGRPLAEAAIDLMHRIHEDFTYESYSTDVSTPVLEAFGTRRGVCQDFAHVMIGCLRAIGLAARYVSGYLMSQPPAGQARLIGADASHAWVSVHVPQLGANGDWLELDPTNDMVPGASHVVLAVGRDYGDVTPLRGVIRGGGGHDLSVAVTVAPDFEPITGCATGN